MDKPLDVLEAELAEDVAPPEILSPEECRKQFLERIAKENIDLSAEGFDGPKTLKVKSQKTYPFLMDELFQYGTFNLLVGNSGVGKSPLLAQMGISIASGRDFLNRKILVPGTVLYLDGESTAPVWNGVLESVALRHYGLKEVPENFISYGVNYTSHRRDSKRLIARAIDIIQPRLLIVDPLRVFFPEVEKGSSEMMGMLEFFNSIRKQGTTILFIHHLRKHSRGIELPSLKEFPMEWMQEASGTLAIVNHTDTRLGVEDLGGGKIGFGGHVRTTANVNYCELSRVLGENGRPIGYIVASRLSEAEARALEKINTSGARWKHIKELFATEYQATCFINKCMALGLLIKKDDPENGSRYFRTSP